MDDIGAKEVAEGGGGSEIFPLFFARVPRIEMVTWFEARRGRKNGAIGGETSADTSRKGKGEAEATIRSGLVEGGEVSIV